MELAFEITQIYFKLAEDTTDSIKYFDYITFKISSFGTFVQVKTYDRNVQVYLNYIECEYGLIKDTNGSKLYLISSANKEVFFFFFFSFYPYSVLILLYGMFIKLLVHFFFVWV
jgi:hypothetical protein